jgi:hypothetical protein
VMWATVTASISTAVNFYFEVEDSSRTVINTVGFNNVVPGTDFTIPAEFERNATGSGWSRTVGLAIANTNTSAADITLKLVDASGTILATYQTTLNANNQVAMDLSSIVAFQTALPPGDFIGVVTVSSSQPVAAIALGDDFGPFYSTPMIAGRAQ